MRHNETSPPEFSLSQQYHQTPSYRKELSKETPVLDNIDGLAAFTAETCSFVRQGLSVDIFVIGRSGDGKSAISEQLIQKDIGCGEEAIRRCYYNTSMAIEEARRRGILTSPFGKFTPEEYRRLSEEVIRKKLEDTERGRQGTPYLRVLEFPAVEVGVNIGNTIYPYSAERQERDGLYRRRIIGVIGERALHRRTLRMRKEVWEAESVDGLKTVFRKYHIQPDIQNLQPLDMRQRMGPPSSMKRMDADILEQIIERQGDIRVMGIDRSLPVIDKKMVEKDPHLEERALADLYHVKAREAGFEEKDIFIAVNRLIRRRVPYYGSMRNDPELRL